MASTTPLTHRNLLIYQVYVRNHTLEGTFTALSRDLKRIRALGTDVLYLLPVNTIGEKQRKGTRGSPYAIKDYYAINPELGTLEDFRGLIGRAHALGMKVMIDIVFNHTAPDSALIHSHPHYFYTVEGAFANRVGDWWDIVDFEYRGNPDLQEYLIGVLEYYTREGVDGFRFDVASLLPKAFLKRARKRVRAINPASIWLSESVHGAFLRDVRNQGFEGLSESELFEIFDMAYDYDAHPFFERYLNNEGPLEDYVFWLNTQESIYPSNYVKVRNLENHDFGRIAPMVGGDSERLRNWHAFNFFQKGATMIFSGSEASAAHHPDLFEKDTIDFSGEDLTPLFKTLHSVTRGRLFTHGVYSVDKASSDDVIIAKYHYGETWAVGIFNVSKTRSPVRVPLENGTFTNAITGKEVHVEASCIDASQSPIIIQSD